MSRICIIGGAGFIGSYLLKAIKKEQAVFVIDKKEPLSKKDNGYVQGDIRDINFLRKNFPDNIDIVVLLAAEHRDDVSPISLYYDVNVEGTHNVLKVMSERNVNKLIFTSTVAVYGLNKNKPNELSPTHPFNYYGKSKHNAEEIIHKWFENDPENKSVIIVRPTVTFGPGNLGNVYNLLQQITAGKFVMIGKGNNKKSMAYVENVAGFLKFCINANLPGYHIYNYIDKPDMTTKELVQQVEKVIQKKIFPVTIPYFLGYAGAKLLDIISKISKKKFPVTAVRVKKFCATTQFESVNMQSSGYKPLFALEEALEITIKDILNNKTGKEKLKYNSD